MDNGAGWIQSKFSRKAKYIFADYVAREAVDVENADPLPYGSVLGKSGNCTLLAMYRLSGDPDMAKLTEDAIRCKGGRHPSARSHKGRLGLGGDGNLAYAEKSKI